MSRHPADIARDPRARQLLRTLVARHVRDGEPVGSQTLARHAGLDVSPATIRNILASMEEAGLLAAPHSSAGRIPTAQGYRLFVDSLLQVKPLGEGDMQRMRSPLQKVLAAPAMRDLLMNKLACVPAFRDGAEMARLQRAELEAWEPIIRASGFKPES